MSQNMNAQEGQLPFNKEKIKRLSKKLQVALKEKHPELKITEVQEALAVSFGYRNWHSFSGVLDLNDSNVYRTNNEKQETVNQGLNQNHKSQIIGYDEPLEDDAVYIYDEESIERRNSMLFDMLLNLRELGIKLNGDDCPGFLSNKAIFKLSHKNRMFFGRDVIWKEWGWVDNSVERELSFHPAFIVLSKDLVKDLIKNGDKIVSGGSKNLGNACEAKIYATEWLKKNPCKLYSRFRQAYECAGDGDTIVELSRFAPKSPLTQKEIVKEYYVTSFTRPNKLDSYVNVYIPKDVFIKNENLKSVANSKNILFFERLEYIKGCISDDLFKYQIEKDNTKMIVSIMCEGEAKYNCIHMSLKMPTVDKDFNVPHICLVSMYSCDKYFRKSFLEYFNSLKME